MNWKLGLVALGGVVGGSWAPRRKRQLTAAESELWAEATDPVARFGDG